MRDKNKLNEIRRYKRHVKGLTDDSLITDIAYANQIISNNDWDEKDLSTRSWLITLEFAVKELNRRIDN